MKGALDAMREFNNRLVLRKHHREDEGEVSMSRPGFVAIPSAWWMGLEGSRGLSPSAAVVSERLDEARRAVAASVTRVSQVPHEPSLAERFEALANRWEEETGHLSSSLQIVAHPAYYRIIGMGPAVVPLLLRDLERTHRHWFWALHVITGENPVPPDAAGDVARMADAWVAWGRRRRRI